MEKVIIENEREFNIIINNLALEALRCGDVNFTCFNKYKNEIHVLAKKIKITKNIENEFRCSAYTNILNSKEYFIFECVKNKCKDLYVKSMIDESFYLQNLKQNFPFLHAQLKKQGSEFGLLRITKDMTIENSTPRQWFCCNNNAFFISETITGACNSVLQLSSLLCHIYSNSQTDFFIRPNCFYKMELKKANVKHERADWYGQRTINLKLLTGLSEKRHIAKAPNLPSTKQGYYTDLILEPNKDGTLHFKLLEWPEIKNSELSTFNTSYILTRFFHAIFDKSSKEFTHLDGAVSIYKKENYPHPTNNERLSIRPFVKRKIFRLDRQLESSLFFQLLFSFYKSNPIVKEFFSEKEL